MSLSTYITLSLFLFTATWKIDCRCQHWLVGRQNHSTGVCFTGGVQIEATRNDRFEQRQRKQRRAALWTAQRCKERWRQQRWRRGRGRSSSRRKSSVLRDLHNINRYNGSLHAVQTLDSMQWLLPIIRCISSGRLRSRCRPRQLSDHLPIVPHCPLEKPNHCRAFHTISVFVYCSIPFFSILIFFI